MSFIELIILILLPFISFGVLALLVFIVYKFIRPITAPYEHKFLEYQNNLGQLRKRNPESINQIIIKDNLEFKPQNIQLNTDNNKKLERQNISSEILKSSSISARKFLAYDSFKKSIPFIGLALFLFFAGVVTGFFTPETFRLSIEKVFKLAKLRIEGKSALIVFIFIFFHNAVPATLSVFLGRFFAIVPIYLAFINGTVVGVISIELLKNNLDSTRKCNFARFV